MAKDPAFLFYSKDWLEGTAELTSEEKGVYIDLLAHQHQKGSLPPEPKKLAKLSGLSEPDFMPIWAELSTKFIPNGSGRLVNRKLNGIVTERLDKGWRNKIIGTLAAVVRYSGIPKEIADKAKKTFKVDDFLAIAEENLTEKITEWYQFRLKSIANEDGNAIKDIIGAGVIYDIEKYLLDHPAEFTAALTVKPGMTELKGKEILKKCHLWIKGKEQYPKHPAALVATFQTWLLNEKNHTNGTAYQSSNSVGSPVVKNVSERETRGF